MWGNRCFFPLISNNVFEELDPGLKLHFVHWRLLDVKISDRGSGGCTGFANNTNLDEAAKSKPPIFSQTIECSIFRRCCKTDIPDFWQVLSENFVFLCISLANRLRRLESTAGQWWRGGGSKFFLLKNQLLASELSSQRKTHELL